MDTLGLIVAVVVHAADIQDRDGAKRVVAQVAAQAPRLQRIWADGGYRGTLVAWVQERYGWVLEIVKRPGSPVGFQVLPRRWIGERTFGWFGRYRRLSKDYEALPEVSETVIRLAMIALMARRLARKGSF